MNPSQARTTDVAANCFFNGLYRESRLASIVAVGEDRFLTIPIGSNNDIRVKVLRMSKTGMNCYSSTIVRGDSEGKWWEFITFERAVECIVSNAELVGDISASQKSAFLDAVMESHRNTWVALDRYGHHQDDKMWQFLEAEQSLFVGHSMHPAPKSRSNLSIELSQQLSPELKASFCLRWFAASDDIMVGDSAGTESWQDYLFQLRQSDRSLPDEIHEYDHHQGWNVFPMHPWQAEQMLALSSIQAHVKSGQLVDLGFAGQSWSATSSTRALFNPDSPFMLKYSLSVKLTNSIRLLSEKEVKRGVALASICEHLTPSQNELISHELRILQEPAYMGLVDGDGLIIDESLLTMRENPFRASLECAHRSQAVLATLCQQTPYSSDSSVLSSMIHTQSQRKKASGESVALEWFERFCDKVVLPIFTLQSQLGIVLLAHQQNIVVEMEEGLPTRSYFRDCQGVGLTKLAFSLFPNLGSPTETDNYWNDDKVNRYFPYYLIINSAYGVIASLSSLVDEDQLFMTLRLRLLALYESNPADHECLKYVLTSPNLCCKGNFFCYLHGLNENSIPDPSIIYFDLNNPLVATQELAYDL